MIYRFFVFKSGGIENGALSLANRLRFTERGGLMAFEWPSTETANSCATFEIGGFWSDWNHDPVLSQLPERCISTVHSYSTQTSHEAGLVIKCHVHDREEVFAALLGLARKHGLSIADPCFGLLLLTSADETARGQTWLRLRRIQIVDWFSQMVKGVQLMCLGHYGSEDFYIAVHGHGDGKTTSMSAIRFRCTLEDVLYPDEHLECHRRRVVIVGPGEAYKIHFNWESCGKHAGWSADFQHPDCPVIPLGRISARMLRKKYSRENGFPVGMFDPRITENIPDPASRYAYLALFNHKLKKSVPRDVLEELERKRGKQLSERLFCENIKGRELRPNE